MDIKELIKVIKLIESEEEKLKGSEINSYEQLESYLKEKVTNYQTMKCNFFINILNLILIRKLSLTDTCKFYRKLTLGINFKQYY